MESYQSEILVVCNFEKKGKKLLKLNITLATQKH